jgi:ferrochelatase
MACWWGSVPTLGRLAAAPHPDPAGPGSHTHLSSIDHDPFAPRTPKHRADASRRRHVDAVAARRAGESRRREARRSEPPHAPAGSSLRALLAEMQAKAPSLMQRHTVVPSWQGSPGYVDVVAKLVAEQLDSLDDVSEKTTVLFSAHGVPVSYVEEAGDPYKRHIEETVAKVTENVKRRRPATTATFELSFQSRVGPVKWLEPYTDTKLEEIGERGCDSVVVVPISFVSEHIETLEELDIEYREVAEEAGVKHWRRVPALNLDEDFISELATQVRGALAKPVVNSVDACILNSFDLTETPVGMLPGVDEPVEFVNGRTMTVAITLTILFELLADRASVVGLLGLPV